MLILFQGEYITGMEVCNTHCKVVLHSYDNIILIIPLYKLGVVLIEVLMWKATFEARFYVLKMAS